MDSEKFFEMGESYLEGENGLKKDENKACEYFLKAAECGSTVGIDYYVRYCKNPDGAKLLNAIEQNELQTSVPGEYIMALLLCGKTDAVSQKKVLAYEDELKTERDFLYFAKYLEAINYTDTAKIKHYYLTAYIRTSPNTAKEIHQSMVKYGFETSRPNNIIAKDTETLQYLNYGSYSRFGKVNFLKKEIGIEMAKAIMEENLSMFGKGMANKLKDLTPEVNVEYQRIYGLEETVYGFSYTFSQGQSDSITTHTGSGSMELNKTYGVYKSEFFTDEDLISIINKASYDTIPNERVCLSEIHSGTDYLEMIDNTNRIIKNIAEVEIADKYGWSSSTVDATIGDAEKEHEEVSYFVPFYFFTFRLNDKIYTLRVNAVTGKAHHFYNDNPWGMNRGVGGVQTGNSKSFSWGTFFILTLFTGFGGIIYAILHILLKQFRKD